jgi:putative sigma-54 modulation protein
MQVSMTFRNTEAEEWFKDYVNDRLGKIRKFLDKPLEAHVILTVEKFRNVAEVNLMAKGININGKEEAKDMQLAFDSVVDKIETQLKKHKEKTRNRKDSAAKRATAAVASPAEEFEDEMTSKIVETRKMAMVPMSLDEAVMKLESNNSLFVVFRDSMSERINVLYRKEDGNFGLIETSN